MENHGCKQAKIRLRALPSLATFNAIPFNPSGIWTEVLQLPSLPKTSPPPEAQIGIVFPGQFETIGIPLLRGRTFTKRDRAGAPLVAVIDEELARRYFPGEDPLASCRSPKMPPPTCRYAACVRSGDAVLQAVGAR